MSNKEEYRSVEGFENYKISNLGNFISLKFNKVRLIKPSINTSGYKTITISNNQTRTTITIHQLVAMAFLGYVRNGNKSLVVDHIDNDKLNNNLDNLQLITQRENSSKDVKRKTSKYTGVCWDKCKRKWRAYIKVNGVDKNLGRYKCELAAATAYQKALKELV